LSNIIHLFPGNNIVSGLRSLADSAENGELDEDIATIVIGKDVYLLGEVDEEYAGALAVFYLNIGIKTMLSVTDEG